MNQMISIRLSRKTSTALDDLSAKTAQSKSTLIRAALKSYLADYFEILIAKERRIDDSDVLITGKEIRRRLVR